MIRNVNKYLKSPAVAPHIRLSEAGNAGLITVDRKEANNAFNFQMVTNAYEALKSFEDKKKLVILKSSTDEIFCAGNDVKEFASSSVVKVKEGIRDGYRGFHLIATYKIPYVALISGVTIGGASMFTMSSKYRIATEKTIYSAPEAKMGAFNSNGASFFLSRLDKNVGIYMGMTGTRMMGFDVKKIGIASHFVESRNLLDLRQALLNCESSDDVENILEDFSYSPANFETNLDENLERIRKCFAGLTVEQIIENLKLDGSDWADETLTTLRKMSPTSLKVCHRQLSLGRHMSLEDCCKMEFRLNAHFTMKSDLQEGYRAFIIEKDMKPMWNPDTVEEVTDHDISRFFSPLPDGDELTFEVKRSTEGHYIP